MLGAADRLGLGLAIFMTRAQGQSANAAVNAHDGFVYAEIKPRKEGGTVEPFKVYEKRTLERLGWERAYDGWRIWTKDKEVAIEGHSPNS